MRQPEVSLKSSWWHNARSYSSTELWADGIVHSVGLAIALVGGAWLLTLALQATPAAVPPVAIYIVSLVAVLAISLAFNMSPVTPIKRLLARLDQAAIFLLIAGTYTPLLALLGKTPTANLMMAFVWGASIIGVGLKLAIPERFGRLALLLYVGIGWSGILVFDGLSKVLPHATLGLLLAGGVAYMAGIIFHVWEKLRFHNVIWHVFVVLGASLHLWAVIGALT